MQINKTQILKHFRGTLLETYSYYNAWKTIAYSKAPSIVGEKMAKKYLEIQNYHPYFFVLSERAFLISFVMLILHPFDPDERSFSLRKLDEEKTEIFISQNASVLDQLELTRNKVFAHSDINKQTGTLKYYPIPPIEELDDFFVRLFDFYNLLSAEIEGSSTRFDDADTIKGEIETLFVNLFRGESIRLKEVDIEYDWLLNKDRISNQI